MRNVSFQIIVRHKMHFPKIPVNKCIFRNAFFIKDSRLYVWYLIYRPKQSILLFKWPFSAQNQIYERDRGGFYFKKFKCNFPWKLRFPCNLESFAGLPLVTTRVQHLVTILSSLTTVCPQSTIVATQSRDMLAPNIVRLTTWTLDCGSLGHGGWRYGHWN